MEYTIYTIFMIYDLYNLYVHIFGFQNLIAALNEERVSSDFILLRTNSLISQQETTVIQYHDKLILLVWYKIRL